MMTPRRAFFLRCGDRGASVAITEIIDKSWFIGLLNVPAMACKAGNRVRRAWGTSAATKLKAFTESFKYFAKFA
jgi:hypothetical protein